MSSDRYKALCQRIDNMPDWKAAALCAVCASKVAPIVARVALPDTWHLVEQCLNFVWRNVGQCRSSQEGLRLVDSLQSTPEWQCEDNSFLPFIVTEVLDFIRLAISAVADPSCAKKNAEGAVDLLAGLASSYDFSTGRFPSFEATSVPQGSLQAIEEASQERVVKMLEDAADASEETIAALREEALRIAELVRRLLPIVCYDHLSS